MTLEPGSAARPGRRILFAVLCLALVAAVTVLVVRTLGARDTERPAGGGYGTAAERNDVITVTEQFALRTQTYGPKDLDDKGKLTAYADRVGELLTTKFRSDFQQGVQLAEAAVVQTKVEVKAKVNAVGVASLTGDRATAFVAWETTSRYGKTEFSDPRQIRSKVDLVKVKGKWLVDGFEPVTGEAQ
jgi:Mce-associated membrane protein